jgi:hypothetical protein
MSAQVSPEAIEAFKAYKRNLEWAHGHGDVLETYQGKFVAVANRNILDASSDREKLEKAYSGVPGVYIMQVVKRGLKWVL